MDFFAALQFTVSRSNPSENSPPHTKRLLSQEPDQVPFWLWGQGQEGAGGRDGLAGA
jgi:hypothetical protein